MEAEVDELQAQKLQLERTVEEWRWAETLNTQIQCLAATNTETKLKINALIRKLINVLFNFPHNLKNVRFIKNKAFDCRPGLSIDNSSFTGRRLRNTAKLIEEMIRKFEQNYAFGTNKTYLRMRLQFAAQIEQKKLTVL